MLGVKDFEGGDLLRKLFVVLVLKRILIYRILIYT